MIVHRNYCEHEVNVTRENKISTSILIVLTQPDINRLVGWFVGSGVKTAMSSRRWNFC